MAASPFRSVSEYIASKPKDVRVALRRVRAAIRTGVPAAEETLSYQMPTYRLDGVPVLYFAGWKEHFSLYPATGRLVEEFGDELERYVVSKGTIRFPLSQPVPVRLIERIARFRAEENDARQKAKRGQRRISSLRWLPTSQTKL